LCDDGPASGIRLSAPHDWLEVRLEARVAALSAGDNTKCFVAELHDVVSDVRARLDEESDGGLDPLIDEAPRLACRLDQLHRARQSVRVELYALQRQAIAGAPSIYIERHLRRFRAAWRAYCARVDALFQETYLQDLGVAG
jgi:hypothetical protein